MENILNVINFIRGVEPRDRSIDLVEPVRNQIRLLKENDLPGTFLLMYDAMLRDDIMDLIRPLDPEQFELGLWLEFCQPQCEAAGIKWRGRPGWEWDYHANVGFSVGYTRAEREKLADVQVELFEKLFGYKPKSVGSWMIDAYTLGYLSDKYGIVASCNCKDQWGTDGYTIWGGYWNQGYYPSRKNVLSPAQTEENKIPVPVFRMLGSDPVTQYDLGLSIEDGAVECQSVASLEPTYRNVGGQASWVDWFMRQNFTGGSLAFAYAQAGQENSFGWPAMRVGLEYQIPLFAKWKKEHGLRVEKLMDTGIWYRDNFDQTPATAISALEPYGERQAQSVWYNCRNYRVNLYRDAKGLRLRDMTLFDENYEERYLDAVCETEYLVYDNLGIMDANRFSGSGIRAGGWLTDAEGNILSGSALQTKEDGSSLTASFEGGAFEMDEETICLKGDFGLKFAWNKAKTPFIAAEDDALLYEHNHRRYALKVLCGKIVGGDQPLLLPIDGKLILKPERR